MLLIIRIYEQIKKCLYLVYLSTCSSPNVGVGRPCISSVYLCVRLSNGQLYLFGLYSIFY